jgi:integrase
MSTVKKPVKCEYCRGPLDALGCPSPFCRQRAEEAREQKVRPRAFSKGLADLIGPNIDARGTTAAKLAWAIVAETGLLVEEIANIRRSDVDLTDCQLFVRRQKTTAARWVPFGGDTREYLLEWLEQRDPSVGHDRLLHRPDGRPYEGSSLRTAFSRAITWEDAEVAPL